MREAEIAEEIENPREIIIDTAIYQMVCCLVTEPSADVDPVSFYEEQRAVLAGLITQVIRVRAEIVADRRVASEAEHAKLQAVIAEDNAALH